MFTTPARRKEHRPHGNSRARRRIVLGLGSAVAVTASAVATGTLLPSASAATWPTANGSKAVGATIKVPASTTYDGTMIRFYGTGALGTGDQSEDQDPIFDLQPGATLRNVIIGSPAADGVHCEGSCTLQNVWWEDVGEDAATFRGSSSSNVYLVQGGGARHADDKVLQFNGAGRLVVSNFAVQDFGKLVRSCGNCSTQYKRTIELNTIEATYKGGAIAGINTNYGDTVSLRNITVVGDSGRKIVPCQKYIGNNTGAEPPKNGSDADGTYCDYKPSDITYK